MSPFHQIPLLALIAAALLAVAGCGGDSDETSGGGDTQPAADLVAQADEICQQAEDERPEAPTIRAGASAAELEKTADYFRTDLRLTKRTLDQLSELTPPEGLEDQWQTVLDGFQAVVDNYPAMIDAAESGDLEAFTEAIGEIQKSTEDLPRAAAEIGLEVCANPG